MHPPSRKHKAPLFPIVPVMKRDGSIRVCGDYKLTINQVALVDTYPLPLVQDIFASLANGSSFTKLDLAHAYQQLNLDDESRPYTTINTHRGLFRYTRLPFGVAAAPAIFQRTMESLLGDLPHVCMYLDDILVTGESETAHLQNLASVLERLTSAGVRLKREKCAFMIPEVEYLGHRISAEGIYPVPEKVKAVREAPTPKDVSQLRSFLGLVNYYGKFLPNMTTLLRPLYDLLQSARRWSWGKFQDQAFRKAKELLSSAPVLTCILLQSLSFYGILLQSLSFAGILLQSLSFAGILLQSLSFAGILLQSLSFAGILLQSLSFAGILLQSLSFYGILL